jgi:hypothetical protein
MLPPNQLKPYIWDTVLAHLHAEDWESLTLVNHHLRDLVDPDDAMPNPDVGYHHHHHHYHPPLSPERVAFFQCVRNELYQVDFPPDTPPIGEIRLHSLVKGTVKILRHLPRDSTLAEMAKALASTSLLGEEEFHGAFNTMIVFVGTIDSATGADFIKRAFYFTLRLSGGPISFSFIAVPRSYFVTHRLNQPLLAERMSVWPPEMIIAKNLGLLGGGTEQPLISSLPSAISKFLAKRFDAYEPPPPPPLPSLRPLERHRTLFPLSLQQLALLATCRSLISTRSLFTDEIHLGSGSSSADTDAMKQLQFLALHTTIPAHKLWLKNFTRSIPK